MVNVNGVLRFFKGYETLLTFDNQKSVFYLEIFGHYRPGVCCRRLFYIR